MADAPMQPTVTVSLPAELVAKMDELKQYREEDQNKSVEEIVHEMCQSYVRVREMAQWELAHRDEIEQSYRDRPNDWDDADVWAEAYPPEEDKQK